MAHIRELGQKCQRHPEKRATCEVFNDVNASLGVFCGPCGKSRLKEFEREREEWKKKEEARAAAEVALKQEWTCVPHVHYFQGAFGHCVCGKERPE